MIQDGDVQALRALGQERHVGAVFEVLTKDRKNEYLILDTTLVRAHQQAATGKGGPKSGFGTFPRRTDQQIHMPADALGHPLHFILTGGHVHDVVPAPALLDGISGGDAVIADKAYDSSTVSQLIADAGMLAVIPSTRSRKVAIPHHIALYKERN